MVKFAYNNTKNISTGYMLFKLYFKYYFWVFYEKNINSCFKFKSKNKLLTELQELITIYSKTLYYIQEFQKQGHNKKIKPRNHASNNKIWFNSKYIKIKQNRELEAKFFDLFQMLHLINKYVKKFKLTKKSGKFIMFFIYHF